MKNPFILLVTITGSLFFCVMLFACEPCASRFNLIETIQKADLIILGQKSGDGEVGSLEQPEWIEVRIISVLKGKTMEDKIKVNSWDGDCPYGVVIDDRKYVMFLAKRETSDEEYTYDTLNSGCAVKTFLVDAEMVSVQGKKMPLDEFVTMIDSCAAHQ